jgi:hypothetical protein
MNDHERFSASRSIRWPGFVLIWALVLGSLSAASGGSRSLQSGIMVLAGLSMVGVSALRVLQPDWREWSRHSDPLTRFGARSISPLSLLQRRDRSLIRRLEHFETGLWAAAGFTLIVIALVHLTR